VSQPPSSAFVVAVAALSFAFGFAFAIKRCGRNYCYICIIYEKLQEQGQVFHGQESWEPLLDSEEGKEGSFWTQKRQGRSDNGGNHQKEVFANRRQLLWTAGEVMRRK